jgi:hypothetical protein
MTLQELLIQTGINVGASFVYEKISNLFRNRTTVTKQELIAELRPFLNIQNAEVIADRIVTFMAQNGDIIIDGTKIYASDSITMASSASTKFVVQNNSESTTHTTSIKVGQGAAIVGQGGARIDQHPDGSITFST